MDRYCIVYRVPDSVADTNPFFTQDSDPAFQNDADPYQHHSQMPDPDPN